MEALKFLFLIALSANFKECFAFVAFGSCPPTPIINNFSTRSYAGLWYEIERFPNWFETGLSCITAEYGFIDDSTVTVKNGGIRFSNNNQTTITEGKAVVPNPSQPNKLQVKFPIKIFGYPIWENSGDYQVWSTDYNTYSLVYSCTQLIPGFLRTESAWILARQKTLSVTVSNELKGLLGQARIDSKKFIKADQSC